MEIEPWRFWGLAPIKGEAMNNTDIDLAKGLKHDCCRINGVSV